MIAAFIHWFLLMILQTDRCFFIYRQENKVVLISKLLAFLLLEGIWIASVRLYKGWKEDCPRAKRFIHIWSGYALFVCLALLILWPGTWSWDDLWVLSNAQHYHLMPWQHVLSSYEQIVLLQLFPTPGGYVFVKNLLIAAIIAYCICKTETAFQLPSVFSHHYWGDIGFKLLPFFLPPVLMYQFSGYRIGLYVYLELLMLVVMACSWKEKFSWSGSKIAAFSIVTAVCACWRSESILYTLLGMAFFGFSPNRTLTRKKRVLGAAAVLILVCGLSSWQKNALGNNNYAVISTLRPGVELVRHSDEAKDGDELRQIDKVADIQKIKAHPDHNGEVAYWGDEVVRKNYSKKEYKNYLHALGRLTLRYPSIVIKERLHLLASASGFGHGQYQNVNTSVDMLIPGKNQYKAFSSVKTENKYPVFQKLRSKTIHFIGMEWKGKQIQPFHALEWNIGVPILVLVAAWLRMAAERQWGAVLLLTAVLLKLPIVILTAPSAWFMYYLSFYFLGYVLLDFYLVKRIGKQKRMVCNER